MKRLFLISLTLVIAVTLRAQVVDTDHPLPSVRLPIIHQLPSVQNLPNIPSHTIRSVERTTNSEQNLSQVKVRKERKSMWILGVERASFSEYDEYYDEYYNEISYKLKISWLYPIGSSQQSLMPFFGFGAGVGLMGYSIRNLYPGGDIHASLGAMIPIASTNIKIDLRVEPTCLLIDYVDDAMLALGFAAGAWWRHFGIQLGYNLISGDGMSPDFNIGCSGMRMQLLWSF